MKNHVLAALAAGTMLVGGVVVANAQWSLGNRGATDAGAGDQASSAYARGDAARDCGFVTVREHHGNEVVVRRIPRC
jgi:hypothetical protein